VTDSLAVWLLNSAVEVEVDGADDSFYLLPRLYGVWQQGGCVEDTHMICSLRIFLAVSEDGEAPAQALYELGEVGEVVGAKVVLDYGLEDPRLRLFVLNYPRDVFPYAPQLVREQRGYELDFDLSSVRVTPIQGP